MKPTVLRREGERPFAQFWKGLTESLDRTGARVECGIAFASVRLIGFQNELLTRVALILGTPTSFGRVVMFEAPRESLCVGERSVVFHAHSH